MAEPEKKPEEKKVETPPEKKPEEKKPDPKIEESEVDDLGYQKVKSDEKKPEEKKPEPKPKEEPKVDPATGYDKEPEKVEPEEKPKEDDKKDVELGYELKVDSIIPKEELTGIKEFAKANEMSQKQVQAYIDRRAGQIKSFVEAQEKADKAAERQMKELRVSWHKELKDDPTFGGDKFDHNVKMVEKVLEEFFPNTKKELTKRGSMLPPYVMRDYAKLADKLYSTEKLTEGDPVVPTEEKKEDDFLSEMYQ
jgi:hypothetical protein